MIFINPQDSSPIYRQVVDQVKLMVMSGRYVPGEQLESVSSLSARLKVNPMTISKAYGILVDEGTAERRKGVGIFVAAVSPAKADRERNRLLEATLKEAAGLVVQLEVSRDQAVSTLKRYIDQYRKTKGSKSS